MVVATWIMISPLVAFSDDHNELASTVYGQSIMLEVQNPTAVVAAMNRFNSSESGKAYPGTVLLNEMVAGGETNVTHQISVFFPSSAALDASNTNSVGNPDAMAFGMTMQQSASIAGRGLFRMMRGKGNVSTPGAVTYQIQLEVTDRAAFMTLLTGCGPLTRSPIFPEEYTLATLWVTARIPPLIG
jgi:hypothetical protein